MPRLKLCVLTAAVAASLAAQAQAHSPYDGRWRVTIRKLAGSCRASGPYTLSIRDGLVFYRGLMPVLIRGAVDRQGRVRVALSGGAERAYAAGRLRKRRGGGIWRGLSHRGRCSGRWWAERR